jgi:hypothetical protein
MAKKKQDLGRCVGCRKEIIRYGSTRSTGDDAVDIRIGKIRPHTFQEPAGFMEKKVWGRMHLACFSRVIGAPEPIEDFDIHGQ